MSEERDRILKMVENGSISAGEAGDLLASLAEDEESGSDSDAWSTAAQSDAPWEAPVIAGVVMSGFGLLGLTRGRGMGVVGRIGAWTTLALGLVALVVGLWSRNAPWLHVRIREAEGKTHDIHLPLPLPLATQIISLVRGSVDDETAGHLDSALSFIEALQRGEKQDPLRIEVDDGDGSRVQIIIA